MLVRFVFLFCSHRSSNRPCCVFGHSLFASQRRYRAEEEQELEESRPAQSSNTLPSSSSLSFTSGPGSSPPFPTALSSSQSSSSLLTSSHPTSLNMTNLTSGLVLVFILSSFVRFCLSRSNDFLERARRNLFVAIVASTGHLGVFLDLFTLVHFLVFLEIENSIKVVFVGIFMVIIINICVLLF